MSERHIYTCSDGGKYYYTGFRSPGEDRTVAWFGGRPDHVFGNVFFGREFTRRVSGRDLTGIRGDWFDVPYGRARSRGTLACLFTSTPPHGSLERDEQTGGFGGSSWRPIDDWSRHRFLPMEVPDDLSSSEDLTGVWKSNRDGIYYVRQVGTTVMWFGTVDNRTAANVFRGTVTDRELRGRWIDIPYGGQTDRGELALDLCGGRGTNAMSKRAGQPGFGEDAWVRLTG